jgi:hypothetical protein
MQALQPSWLVVGVHAVHLGGLALSADILGS